MSVRHLSMLGTMFVCAVAVAGDLNPPPGAVSPTMLPLDRIEPRVCVNDLPGSADAMHVITQPGVYFVGADIAAGPGMSAIVIDVAPGQVGQVVLDLGGFTLHGSGVGGASGLRVLQAGPIYVLSPNSGRIANFGGHGIETLGVSQVSIDGVNITDCAGDGVHVASSGEVLISADVRACAGNGVTVLQSGAVSIVDTTIAQTGGDGVHVFQAAELVISSIGVAGAAGDGIEIIEPDFVAIKECVLPAAWHRAQQKKWKESQSRVAGSGGNGVVITDGGDIEIDDLLIDGAGGNGVMLLAPQVVSRAIIRRTHVRETIDALYAENLRSVEIIDWRDVDSDDDGIDIVGIAGGAPGDGVYTISDAVSERALGSAISVTGPGGGAGGGSVSISNARAAGTGDRVLVAKMHRVELARVVADGGGIAPAGIEIDAVDASLHDVHATRAAGPGGSLVVSGALTVSGFVSERNDGEGLIVAGLGSGKVNIKDFSFTDNGAGVGGVVADGAVFFECDTLALHGGESSGNSGSGLRIIDLNRDGRLDLVTCSANGANGVSVESPSGVGAGRFVVSNGAFGSNGGDGLFLEATTGGQVVDCTATNNSGWGIRVLGSNHVIQRNACLGNFGGSLLAAAPGNIVGPMVNELTVGANTNPAANYE